MGGLFKDRGIPILDKLVYNFVHCIVYPCLLKIISWNFHPFLVLVTLMAPLFYPFVHTCFLVQTFFSHTSFLLICLIITYHYLPSLSIRFTQLLSVNTPHFFFFFTPFISLSPLLASIFQHFPSLVPLEPPGSWQSFFTSLLPQFLWRSFA